MPLVGSGQGPEKVEVHICIIFAAGSFEKKATGGYDRVDRAAEDEDVRTAHEKYRDYDGEIEPYADRYFPDDLFHLVSANREVPWSPFPNIAGMSARNRSSWCAREPKSSHCSPGHDHRYKYSGPEPIPISYRPARSVPSLP